MLSCGWVVVKASSGLTNKLCVLQALAFSHRLVSVRVTLTRTKGTGVMGESVCTTTAQAVTSCSQFAFPLSFCVHHVWTATVRTHYRCLVLVRTLHSVHESTPATLTRALTATVACPGLQGLRFCCGLNGTLLQVRFSFSQLCKRFGKLQFKGFSLAF